MDPSSLQSSPSFGDEDDEWDTDGFVIPSFGVGDSDSSQTNAPQLDLKPSSPKVKEEKDLYLGPHGAPPSQSKSRELNSSGRKQRFKQKLKEADQRISGAGRENKLENLRELGGGGKETLNMSKGSTRY